MKYFFTCALFMLTCSLFAQTDCLCCSDNYQQFDFWVGDWSVTDTAGNMVGNNQITKTEANCLITEHWIGLSGSTGRSMNYFDKSDSTWNQLWVDNSGGVLKLKGNLVSGKMVLRSKSIQGQKLAYYNQISWAPSEDGTVNQLWAIYDNSDQLLQVLFEGIYHKKP